ncbi:MAG: hypothetical protein GY711_03855 [bacterium]|nr:hypothetical protein [bacterium]
MKRDDEHVYRGARAMVHLHDEQMRGFLTVWRRAAERGLQLPETNDPDYASLEHLLRHVVGCARGYMVWMCEVLGLPDPEIEALPDAAALAPRVDEYLAHVLERWRVPLRDVSDKRFGEVYDARWGTAYSVDAMMEHAVMHPIRHAFQLEELMGERG